MSSVELPPDSQKLKRHIALLCDRISKGGSLRGAEQQREPVEATQSLTNGGEGEGGGKGGEGRGGRGGRGGGRRGGMVKGQTRPEVLSRLPVNHAVRKMPLPSLPEDSAEGEQTEIAYQQTDL